MDKANDLIDRHRDELRASGLTDETIAISGIYSARPRDIGKLLGWERNKRAGYVIPYLDTDYIRVKLDRQRPKGGKYEAPRGKPPRAYFPVAEALNKPGHLIIVEGEKKALALWQAGYSVIGLAGVWSWQVKRKRDSNGRGIGERKLIPDLQKLQWAGRKVIICFDSDITTNRTIQHAEQELAALLKIRGASVLCSRIPNDNGMSKLGADDYIVANGPDAFRRLLEQAQPAAPPVTLTDLGFAERLVHEHGSDLRYCVSLGWLAWDGRHWLRDETGEVQRRCKATIRAFRKWANYNAKNADQRKAWAVEGLAREQNGKVKGIIELARSEPSIPVEVSQLDAHPWLFNCLNGTLDLRTGLLQPHHRGDLITKLANCEYDAKAECPNWKAFLKTTFQGDKEMLRFVQRAIGHALTGVIGEHCLHILYGVGANGKTTLLNVIARILGDYATAGPPRMLIMRHGEQHPTELADLCGRRLVVFSESAEGSRLDEERVKMLTGGDRIKGRLMRQDFFEFAPTHKLFLCTNHRPDVKGRDEGIWRRIKLWPFQHVVPKHEQDRDLTKRLIDEGPGILAWCVRGCKLWQRDGLNDPPAVWQSTQSYRQESDEIGEFLSTMTIVGEGLRCQAANLYAAFKTWGGTLSQTAFGRGLKDRGLNKKVSRGLVVYQGFGLASEEVVRPSVRKPVAAG